MALGAEPAEPVAGPGSLSGLNCPTDCAVLHFAPSPTHQMLFRWGNTPLDEAKRVGAAAISAYLQRAAEGRQQAERAAGQGRPHVLRPLTGDVA